MYKTAGFYIPSRSNLFPCVDVLAPRRFTVSLQVVHAGLDIEVRSVPHDHLSMSLTFLLQKGQENQFHD